MQGPDALATKRGVARCWLMAYERLLATWGRGSVGGWGRRANQVADQSLGGAGGTHGQREGGGDGAAAGADAVFF